MESYGIVSLTKSAIGFVMSVTLTYPELSMDS